MLSIKEKKQRLRELLTIMGIPQKVIDNLDFEWLRQNMSNDKATHELYDEAKELVLSLDREENNLHK